MQIIGVKLLPGRADIFNGSFSVILTLNFKKLRHE